MELSFDLLKAFAVLGLVFGMLYKVLSALTLPSGSVGSRGRISSATGRCGRIIARRRRNLHER